MADGLGRVPVEAEVAAGDGEVGGDGQVVAGVGAEEGAVVADAQKQVGVGCLSRAGANPGEQGQLAGGGRRRPIALILP